MAEPRSELTRTLLGVAALALLAGLSLWIMRPFLLALIWAGAIVAATWPLLLRARRRCRGNRALAAAVMTLALVLTFLLPMLIVVGSVAVEAGSIAAWLRSVHHIDLPHPPQLLLDVPVLGEKLQTLWRDLTHASWSAFRPYLEIVFAWLVLHLSGIGTALVEIVMTVLIAAILYFHGDSAARGVLQFCTRLAGPRGTKSALLATQAVRAIALGVIGTAVVQAIVGGAGLAIAGVPLALPLTLLTFILSVAQIGPLPVLLPAILWLYATGRPGGGTVLLVFAALAATLDNVLQPYLIRRGADLPLLLIFAGVTGGLLSMGLVGVFLGPVVLAVTYRLLEEWVLEHRPADAPAA